MPSLNTKFNWGMEIRNVNDVLYNQLNDTYSDIARVLNTKSSKNQQTTNPPSDAQVNSNYDIGDFWVNQLTNTAWVMTSRTTSTAATWTQIT